MTKSTIWTIERKVRNSYVYKHVNKTFLDWYVKFSLHITKKYMHTVHIYVDTVHARKHMPKWGNAKISNSRFSIGWIENRHIITMGWISKDRFIAPLWKLRCVGVEFQLLFFFENRCHTCRLDVFFRSQSCDTLPIWALKRKQRRQRENYKVFARSSQIGPLWYRLVLFQGH